ncbi:50S ribosomal protein L6 [Patescibacteria group bacterium]|nr:50S ribosomal protein L6 [Patescibacteria group bacterium]
MSLIGKKPILIPAGVQVKLEDGNFFAKGPLGESSRFFKNDINITIGEKEITLKPKKDDNKIAALWGTYASHIKNMIEGVTKGFEKVLVIEGIGYKAQTDGQNIILNLGFSHLIKVEITNGLKVTIEKNVIKIFGINKEEVGSFGAKIRALKKPEPYKGKGIRYEKEIVRRKSGKKAATAA